MSLSVSANSGPIAPSITHAPLPERRAPAPAGSGEAPQTVNCADDLRRKLSEQDVWIRKAAKDPNSVCGMVYSLGVLHQAGLLSDARFKSRLVGLSNRDVQDNAGGAGGGIANWVWSLIHPAPSIWGAAWNRLPRVEDFCRVHERLSHVRKSCSLKSTTFYSEDNVQLDGLLLSLDKRPKPTMLMVLGNADMAENNVEVALAHARQLDVNVLLFNGRGVGLSLGDITRPEQAHIDVKAAVAHAAHYKQPVLVWTTSLGGGLATQVLKNMRSDKHPAFKYVKGLAIVNSFPSLASVVGHLAKQNVGLPASILAGASSKTLQLLGINPMESLAALGGDGVGVPTLVANSLEDTVMHDDSSLARQLLAGHVESPNLQIIEEEAGAHNAYYEFLANPAYVEALTEWRTTQQPADA